MVYAENSFEVKSVKGNTGKVENDFLTVDGNVAYCAEQKIQKYPNTSGTMYDDVITTADAYERYCRTNRSNSAQYWLGGANHWEDIKKVLYFGYPKDGANIKGDASDDDFRTAT